jgi:hypothetical protein
MCARPDIAAAKLTSDPWATTAPVSPQEKPYIPVRSGWLRGVVPDRWHQPGAWLALSWEWLAFDGYPPPTGTNPFRKEVWAALAVCQLRV